MGGCIVRWVGGWVDGLGQVKTHGWVCAWLGGSVGQFVGSGQMTNNCISLDLIDIIQFCLKIYDL